jgi:methionyl-tRNA formyltransferase
VCAESSRDEPREDSAHTAAPGTIIGLKPDTIVQCGDGALALLEVQAPGRRRMAATACLRGRRVAAGARLGS